MTAPETKAELIAMGPHLTDVRQRLRNNRTFENTMAAGRASSDFEAACRDWPNRADVTEAEQAQRDRIWQWHTLYEHFARAWLARHPLPWLKTEPRQ